jgi:hypothetical protein
MGANRNRRLLAESGLAALEAEITERCRSIHISLATILPINPDHPREAGQPVLFDRGSQAVTSRPDA